MANLSSPATNVTDATRAEFYRKALATKRQIEEAQEVVRSAVAVHRSLLKEAKKAGVDTDALTRTLAARLEDPDVVIRRDQEYIRMRVIAGGMPKEQLTIFSELFKADLPDDMRAAISREKVYDDGYFAGTEGKSATFNPHFQGTDEHDTWHRAWLLGQQKIVEGMAPKKPAGTPKPRKGKVTGEPLAQAAE